MSHDEHSQIDFGGHGQGMMRSHGSLVAELLHSPTRNCQPQEAELLCKCGCICDPGQMIVFQYASCYHLSRGWKEIIS